jgi:hypothetical protein
MFLANKRVAIPIAAGLAGAALLSGIYLGLVSLAESPAHALELFWADRLFVVPILLGFGIQVGLFVFLKLGLFAPASAAGAVTTAAGGGVSTAAMVACCVHHLADVLPLIGLTAAATFLTAWKVPFMAVGLLTNFVGIGVMLRQIVLARRHACQMLATQLSTPQAAPAGADA